MLVDRGLAERGMVVGYDNRFASEHFAAAAAEVLAGNGIKVYLCHQAAPTPMISYAVLDKRTAGAITITASHNPPTDNGFKVRSEYAGAADPETLREIEDWISKINQVVKIDYDEAVEKGLIQTFDAAPAYLVQLRKMIDVEPIKEAGLTVAVDSMWGTGAGWLARILKGGKTKVVEVHNGRRPLFPEMTRPEPIPPNVDKLFEVVKEVGADIGLATDGDADRLGVSDERGNFVNQLQVYALMALYLLEVRGWRGAIVKTLSTTSMLEKLGKMYDVPVHQTGVGFKYVAPKMLETEAIIGGEESGGFAFKGHIPERDGILAGLFLLDLMVQLGKSPSQLIEYLYSKVGPHYYDRIDTTFPQEKREAIFQRLNTAQPEKIAGLKVTEVKTLDGFKFEMGEAGWLLVRFSGTEPIIRVYTETTQEEKVQDILAEGMKLAGL